MPRAPRVCYENAIYHVTTRTVAERDTLFAVEGDRRLFLDVLGKSFPRYDVLCHAYCLMDTHYHLVLRTPRANLPLAMQQLNGQYAQTFNVTRARRGHLFGARYYGELIASERHLLETLRYIVLNPVRAGMCALPGAWPWSSYAAAVGEAPQPPFLDLRWLADFGDDRDTARARYAAFVQDRMPRRLPASLAA